MRKLIVSTSVAVAIGVVAVMVVSSPGLTRAEAQVSKSKSRYSRSKSAKTSTSTKNTKELDVRAEQIQESFVKETADLARSYEDAGDLEKSKVLLETILKLNPKVPGVGAKLRELDEQILTANEVDLEVDTSSGWGDPRGRVAKGKPFKIQAQGTYRLVASLTVGPDGFPSKDAINDMAAGVPCGALMGLIVAKKKPGRPFTIGSGQTITPKEDGLLFMRVNVPPGSKCSGRIKVRLSGYVGTL